MDPLFRLLTPETYMRIGTYLVGGRDLNSACKHHTDQRPVHPRVVSPCAEPSERRADGVLAASDCQQQLCELHRLDGRPLGGGFEGRDVTHRIILASLLNEKVGERCADRQRAMAALSKGT
jgi:hypothetical protein